MKKNISRDYAYMLIESIEPRVRELVDSYDTEKIIGWILFVLGGALIMFSLNSDPVTATFLLWGSVLALGGIIRLVTSYIKRGNIKPLLET